MHALNKMILGFAGLALPIVSQAHAATLVPVTPPVGAVQTLVFGINKHNVIAGAWIDANDVAHGFIGPLNGSYTSFDFGGTSTGTLPRALDDDGNIVGFAEDPSFSIGEEFLRREAEPAGGLLDDLEQVLDGTHAVLDTLDLGHDFVGG